MTDSHDDAVVPETKKNKGGRPRKTKAPDMEQVVRDLQEQIAIMQRAALANQAANADRFDRVQQKATLDLIPEASPQRPPGSYIQIGLDASGAPIIGKVRWTKSIIEETYPEVTFVPIREFTCYPHGVAYRVEASKQVTVPSIVKDLYDTALRVEKEMEDKYRPLSAIERAELDARASEQPGVGQRSRVYRIGAGLNVHAASDLADAAKAAETK